MPISVVLFRRWMSFPGGHRSIRFFVLGNKIGMVRMSKKKRDGRGEEQEMVNQKGQRP